VPDLTPWTWLAAFEAVISNASIWDGKPPQIVLGNPTGFLDRCDCDEGQVLIKAGPVFFAGERWPETDLFPPRIKDECGADWGCNITVEFARCRPVMDQSGVVPAAAVVRSHAERLYNDGWALWGVLRDAEAEWRRQVGPVLVRGWAPIERELGPCSGFFYESTVKVKRCPEN